LCSATNNPIGTWTFEYYPDKLWTKNTESEYTDNTPIPKSCDDKWENVLPSEYRQTDNSKKKYNTYINTDKTFFPQGHSYGELSTLFYNISRNTYENLSDAEVDNYENLSDAEVDNIERVMNEKKKNKGIWIDKFSQSSSETLRSEFNDSVSFYRKLPNVGNMHAAVETKYGLPELDHVGPIIEYKTKHELPEACDDNTSKQSDSDWKRILTNKDRWISLEENMHRIYNTTNKCLYTEDGEVQSSTEQDVKDKYWVYSIPDLHMVVSYKNSQLDHNEVTFELQKDNINLSYNTRIEASKKNEYKYTAKIKRKDWKLGKYIEFNNLDFINKNSAAVNQKAHGTLACSFRQRLNSRLPLIENDGNTRIKGLTSINRFNLIDNELMVSMWHNIRTVAGVARSTSNSKDGSYNNSNVRESVHPIANNQPGFAKIVDADGKSLEYFDKSVTDKVYEYEHIHNDYKDVVEPLVTMESCNGNEIISVDKSNWHLYAYSAPLPIYKQMDKNGNIRLSKCFYDPKINYKLSLDSYEDSAEDKNYIKYLEKHRIDYLEREKQIHNDNSDPYHYGTLINKDGMHCGSEEYLGIRFKLNSTFNLNNGSTYLIDTYTPGALSTKWHRGKTEIHSHHLEYVSVDENVNISLDDAELNNIINVNSYRNVYNAFTNESIHFQYGKSDNSLTTWRSARMSYEIGMPIKELAIPNINESEYMTSRLLWCSSRPMNIWYRDSARSVKEQNKIIMKLKNSVTAIMDHIVDGHPNPPADSIERIKWWKTYCAEKDSSINIQDLMKITKDNGNDEGDTFSSDNVWPCKSKLDNVITPFLNKGRNDAIVNKQLQIIETSRLQLARMLYEYDHSLFEQTNENSQIIPIENVSYSRTDEINEHINYQTIIDGTIKDDEGNILWVLRENCESDPKLNKYLNKATPKNKIDDWDNNSNCFIPLNHPNANKFKPVEIKIVQTGQSHPPGLEHRIDEVESLLDNSLSSLPILENRLEGIEGVVKDYDNVKNYLAEEINSLKNIKIEENLDNAEQMEQLRRFVRNELYELKNEQNNINEDDSINNDLLSMNERLVKLENKETTTLDNNQESNLLSMNERLVQLENKAITTLDNNQESNILLNEMITIKNDISEIKEQVNTSLSQANEVKTEVTTIRDEIVSTNQKIKKVLKKANLH
jgi:hypothetical protein